MNREDIIRMAWKAGFERLGHTDNDWVCYPEDIERFAALVAFAERERLAKVFDELDKGIGFYDPCEPAEIIRGQA